MRTLLMKLLYVWMLLFLLLLLKMKLWYRLEEWTRFFSSGLGLFECSCEHRNELPVYIKGGKFFNS